MGQLGGRVGGKGDEEEEKEKEKMKRRTQDGPIAPSVVFPGSQ